MMVDIAADLSSLCFETGLTDDERQLVYLRARSSGLTFCGCVHAIFVCEQIHALRCALERHVDVRGSLSSGDLCVGVLGFGHLGKQVLLSLLEKASIKSSHIKISTRRPEAAVIATLSPKTRLECGIEDLADMRTDINIAQFHPDQSFHLFEIFMGYIPPDVECFFDNCRLAAWADVLFICCLPSHLPKVCADLRSRLSKHCLVYSFISAVPVTRLASLLGHDFVLKPQYTFVSCDTADMWLSCSRLTTALTDTSLIEASCPLSTKGGITLGLNWVCAVLYSLLNICTSAGLGSNETLSVINSIFKDTQPNMMQLNALHFISSSHASTLPSDEPFPWISLADAQTKETPLLRFLSSSKALQQCISAAFLSQLQRPIK